MGKKGMEMLWGLPIPFWETVFRWSTIAAFVLGGFAATCAFVSAWVGYELSDVMQKAANVEILDARARSDEARAEAAKANEGMAAAKERTAQLELALEKEKTARLPRTINAEQRAAILHNLKVFMPEPKGKLYVVPSRFDPEAIQYAAQISEILKAAGFTVLEDSGPATTILGYDAPGAWLWMNDAPTAPPHAVAIQKAFWAAGIYLDGQSHPEKFDKESLLVAVSSKPAIPFLPPFGFSPPK
jgi:hypothetical protein